MSQRNKFAVAARLLHVHGGPGVSDSGQGQACDVNDLTQHAPKSFYSALIDRITAVQPGANREYLESQIEGND